MAVNPTIFSGNVVGARRAMGDYSSIVKKQETDVWAEDEYGKTVADGEAGVDDVKVIQSALDVGGNIVISRGEYIINHELLIKNYTKITGELDKTILKLTGGFSLFKSTEGSILWNVKVSDLRIEGTDKTTYKGKAFELYSPRYCRFENLTILYLDQASYIDAKDSVSVHNVFSNIRIQYVNKGVVLTTTGSAKPNYNLLFNVRVLNAIRGIELNTGDTNIVAFCETSNCSDVGFYQAGDNGLILRLRCEGNAKDVKLTSCAQDNIFAYCSFTSTIEDLGTGNKFIECRNYKTKNSGTKTFSGDGSTTDFLIGNHGLVVTDPNRIVVKVTPISQDAINASPCVGYVDPSDNTKIRVKFANPPASGTDNVKIIWKAEVV